MEEKYILYFILVFILAFMLKSRNEPFFVEELNVLALNNSWKNQVHQGSGFLGAFRNGPNDIHLSDDGAIQVSLGSDGGPKAMGALWISKDTGATWTIIADEPGAVGTRAFCMSGDAKFFYYLGANGFVYLSTDQGLTRSQATEIKSYNGGSICCSQNGQYVFVNSGNSAPSLSRDYGKTFTVMKAGGVGPVCMSDDGSRLFSFSGTNDNSDTGIHYSHDNGLTWKWSSTWEMIRAYENVGHMTCDGTGTHILLNSTPCQSLDGGVTFNKITLLNKIQDHGWGRFAISKSGQYISTIFNKEIWESVDYGISWKVVQNESSYLPLVLQPNAVAISRNGLVYVARMNHPTNGLNRDKAIMRQMIRGPSDTQPQQPLSNRVALITSQLTAPEYKPVRTEVKVTAPVVTAAEAAAAAAAAAQQRQTAAAAAAAPQQYQQQYQQAATPAAAPPAAAPTAAPAATETTVAPAKDNTYIYIGGGCVLLIMLIIGIYMFMGKKKVESNE